jgi:hypothetical protein
MAEIKGKFIQLTADLMGAYPKAVEKADAFMKSQTGKTSRDLDPEGWYDTRIWATFMDAYVEASVTGERALVTLGKKVYPKIKTTVGLPPHLKTPLDFIKFEAEGFIANHRGSDVKPRTFVKAQEGHVIVKAPAPGYSPRLYEGVFLGILEMVGVKNGKCVMKDANNPEFEITW